MSAKSSSVKFQPAKRTSCAVLPIDSRSERCASPKKAQASLQQHGHCSDCQAVNPGVRVATSSTTSCGSFAKQSDSVSVNVASNLSAAEPSAMHHGQSESSNSSSAYTGPE